MMEFSKIVMQYLLCFGDSSGKRAQKFNDAKVSWSVTIIKGYNDCRKVNKFLQNLEMFLELLQRNHSEPDEYFEFTTKGSELNKSTAQKDLDKVAVVPNPYTGAASWEPATTDVGRGERRIFFIHLPQECTIRIYTISGKIS